jgi:hypothetical protein
MNTKQTKIVTGARKAVRVSDPLPQTSPDVAAEVAERHQETLRHITDAGNAPRDISDGLDAAIKKARGDRRKSLILLKEAEQNRASWSLAKKQANSINVKLSQEINRENWLEILTLAYELKSLAFESYHAAIARAEEGK